MKFVTVANCTFARQEGGQDSRRCCNNCDTRDIEQLVELRKLQHWHAKNVSENKSNSCKFYICKAGKEGKTSETAEIVEIEQLVELSKLQIATLTC